MDLIFRNKVEEFFTRPEVSESKLDRVTLKGISCPKLGVSFINLSAYQWAVLGEINEDLLITELCKTIVHETVHNEIGTSSYIGIDYTPEGEEIVADILSGQLIIGSILDDGTMCVPT